MRYPASDSNVAQGRKYENIGSVANKKRKQLRSNKNSIDTV